MNFLKNLREGLGSWTHTLPFMPKLGVKGQKAFLLGSGHHSLSRGCPRLSTKDNQLHPALMVKDYPLINSTQRTLVPSLHPIPALYQAPGCLLQLSLEAQVAKSQVQASREPFPCLKLLGLNES